MKFPHAIHPAARREIREAIIWYESKMPGLGQAFRDALFQALEKSVPLAVVDEDRILKKLLLRRFPYRVVLLEGFEAGSVVVAVAHQRRRPGYWKKRLEKARSLLEEPDEPTES